MNGLAAYSERCKWGWLAIVNARNKQWATIVDPVTRMNVDGTWLARRKLFVHWGILYKLGKSGWERVS